MKKGIIPILFFMSIVFLCGCASTKQETVMSELDFAST